MRSQLIVNADDGNLTEGVFRGVIRAHEEGIVSSTTLFANFHLSSELRSTLKARPLLGVGVHLNITLGLPVLKPSEVRSLLAGGEFGEHDEGFFRAVDRKALYREYRAQIERFMNWWGAAPTHLDTHHHIHSFSAVFEVLMRLAEEYELPIRLSEQVSLSVRERFEKKGVRLSDHLIGDLDVSYLLNKERLKKAIDELPDGVTELMTHPGETDNALGDVSSWVKERAEELDALTQPHLVDELREADVELIHYGKLKEVAF